MKAKSQIDIAPPRDAMKVGKETKIAESRGINDDSNVQNINSATQEAVKETSHFGESPEHHKMTHASDHFFPPSQQDATTMQ